MTGFLIFAIVLILGGTGAGWWLLNQIDRDEDCWNHDDHTWLHQEGMTLEEQR